MSKAPSDTCVWTQDSDMNDVWGTSCGNAFLLNEGNPDDNKMEFCLYCGKPIKQHPFCEGENI